MKRRVTAPDGTTWTVRRRQEPSDDTEEDEEDDGEGVSLMDGVLWTLATATAVVVTVVSPKLGIALFFGEAILALLAAAAWMVRGGRPWYVEASTDSLHRDLRWEVRGRRRSKKIVDEVAQALERGHVDVDPLGATRLSGH